MKFFNFFKKTKQYKINKKTKNNNFFLSTNIKICYDLNLNK